MGKNSSANPETLSWSTIKFTKSVKSFEGTTNKTEYQILKAGKQAYVADGNKIDSDRKKKLI